MVIAVFSSGTLDHPYKLCTYWLSGRTRWEIIWLEVCAFWPRARYFPVWPNLTQSISILSYDHYALNFSDRENLNRSVHISSRVQGGKTFCASFCASLIAGSRRAFLCVDCVRLLLEFWVNCTRCECLLPLKHFYLTCLLFFRRLKITLDSEQPMLKEKRIIPSVWGGIKGFEHFLRGEYFLIVHPINLWVDFAGLN